MVHPWAIHPGVLEIYRGNEISVRTDGRTTRKHNASSALTGRRHKKFHCIRGENYIFLEFTAIYISDLKYIVMQHEENINEQIYTNLITFTLSPLKGLLQIHHSQWCLVHFWILSVNMKRPFGLIDKFCLKLVQTCVFNILKAPFWRKHGKSTNYTSIERLLLDNYEYVPDARVHDAGKPASEIQRFPHQQICFDFQLLHRHYPSHHLPLLCLNQAVEYRQTPTFSMDLAAFSNVEWRNNINTGQDMKFGCARCLKFSPSRDVIITQGFSYTVREEFGRWQKSWNKRVISFLFFLYYGDN